MFENELIRKKIEEKKIPMLSLWHGEDRFLREEGLRLLREAFLEDDPSGSSIEVLSAKDIPPLGLVERADSFSFFQRRLLIVENIPYFQEGSSLDLDPLYTYFANPNPGTCLLFVAESVHRGRKFYKEMGKFGQIVEFTAPKRSQDWLEWVQREVKARGKGMPADTAAFFLEWAGHQPGVLTQELNKLAIYIGEEKATIKKQDIETIVPRASEATVFDLLNAVAGRSAERAIVKLHEVLQAEHHLKVMTMLVRQVRLLLGTLAVRGKGGDSSSLPSALGIKPFEAQKLWAQSLQMNFEQLATALEECLKTEIALKNSGGEPGLLLEMLIIKFCKG